MAGKNKLYELMISIGAKKESSLNKACLGASNDLASLGQTRTWLRWGKRQRPRERSLPVPW